MRVPSDRRLSLRPWFPRRQPYDILIQSCTPQIFELLPSLSTVLDFFRGNHSEQKQFANTITRAVPSQPIAARARWQAILGCLRPAFIALDNVVHFPVSVWRFAPTAIRKLDWVAAKMAVPTCLVVNFSQVLFIHSGSNS
jgi:hypothetical protein